LDVDFRRLANKPTLKPELRGSGFFARSADREVEPTSGMSDRINTPFFLLLTLILYNGQLRGAALQC
jgi:hypothetical protein